MKKIKKPPTKDDPSSRCYVERLKRWVPIKEAIERIFHPERFSDEPSSMPQEIPLIVLAVRDFFEQQGGRPVAVPVAEGWYDGLVEFLIEEGLNPQKHLDIYKGFQTVIEQAWKLYRRDHPFKKSKYEEMWDENPEVRPETNHAKRTKLFDHHITAVLRWMGTDSWSYEEAKKALSNLEVFPADPTIRIQLRAGKTGERGPPAKLSDEEISTLYDALNDT